MENPRSRLGERGQHYKCLLLGGLTFWYISKQVFTSKAKQDASFTYTIIVSIVAILCTTGLSSDPPFPAGARLAVQRLAPRT
jgi:hypothetical protein